MSTSPEIKEVLNKLPKHEVYSYKDTDRTGKGAPEDNDQLYLYLGDFDRGEPKDVQPTDYVWVDYLGGSDYSGSLVEKSNQEVFLEQYGTVPGVHSVYGGYGTFGVAIQVSALLDEANEEMIETLEKLDDYPLLDEDHHSNLEIEAQNEAWENDVKSDFRKALSKRLASAIDEWATKNDVETDVDFEELADEITDKISEDDLAKMFYEASDAAGEYWVNEQGDSMYIDVDEVVKKGLHAMDLEDMLAMALKEIELPEGVERPIPVDPRQLKLKGVAERRRR